MPSLLPEIDKNTTYTQKEVAVTITLDGQEAVTFQDLPLSVRSTSPDVLHFLRLR